MITLVHRVYKTFTTYNMENTFTISYENLIIRTMNQVNESEKEECKSIVRTVFFIYCIPYLLLISAINRKFNVDFSIPGSIVFSFLIAMYGFLSKKSFNEIRRKMLQAILFTTVFFIPLLFLKQLFSINLHLLTSVYIGIVLAFTLIILFAYTSFISGNFWVIVAKRIVKHSLSKQSKINVLVLQLELLFGVPLILSIIFSLIKG